MDFSKKVLYFGFYIGWITNIWGIEILGIPITLQFVWSLLVLVLLIFKMNRNLAISYLALGMSISLIFSFFIGLINIGLSYSLISQLVQSILVLSILLFFSGKFDRISFEKASNAAVNLVLIYGVYQFFARIFSLPLAFLPVTNSMIALIDEASGFQRGYRLYGGSRIMEARVSSFFVEPGHLGFYGAFVFFSSRIRSTKNKAAFLILLSQSLGAYVVTLLVLLFQRLDLRNILLFLLVLLLGVFILLRVETNYYFVSRLRLYLDGGWEVIKLQARFADLPLIVKLWKTNPLFGTGLGTIKSVLPDATFSIHYLVILFERGIIGFCIYFSAFFVSKKSSLWLFILLALFWKPYIFYVPLFFTLGILGYENTLRGRQRP
jgi:hypothetical protein